MNNICFERFTALRNGSTAKGRIVIGRNKPTFIPFSRKASIAVLAERATIP